MSQEYALSRVRDALEKSGGNHLKAQRLLQSWLEKDHSLLLGLVAPHLQSIVTHAVNHADSPRKVAGGKKVEIAPDETGEFGVAVLESLKGGRSDGGFGFGEAEPRGAVSRPGRASQSHVDAIHQLAGGKKISKDKNKKD
ncbi:MAG: hypothetical protein ACK4PK_04135 [Alphaproteobacteria bacterium]